MTAALSQRLPPFLLLLTSLAWGGISSAQTAIASPQTAVSEEANRWVRAAERLGEVLLAEQREDGLFDDSRVPGTGPNLATQAEVCRALFLLGRDAEMPAFVEAGDRCLLGLSPFLQAVPGRPGAAALVSHRQGRAGVASLAILAVADRPSLEGDADGAFLPAARALGEFLLSLQSEDGSFRAASTAFPGHSEIPGGEDWDAGRALSALLALHRLAADRDDAADEESEQRLEAVREGLGWVLGVRDLGKSFDRLPADPWLMEALDELHRAEGGGRTYFLHSRRLAWGILRRDTPSGEIVAVRPQSILGLAAAVRLAEREGEEATALRKALGELAGTLAEEVEGGRTQASLEERALAIRGLLLTARMSAE